MTIFKLTTFYIFAFCLSACGGGGGSSQTSTPPPSTAQCTSTHAKIGQQAQLITRFHGVAGLATIVDDCTIRIDNFTYDGGGIAVFIYGGNGDFLTTGFAMSGDLVGPGFNSETVLFTLPQGKTLDDLDRIGVCCVPQAASFGDGVFG